MKRLYSPRSSLILQQDKSTTPLSKWYYLFSWFLRFKKIQCRGEQVVHPYRCYSEFDRLIVFTQS